MIVRRTKGRAEVEAVLKHPEIYNRITQDAAPSREDYQEPMRDRTIYLVDEDAEVGVMIFDPLGPVCYDCHIQVLPDQREHALEFAQACFKWLWSNTSAIKITAQIALIFPDVIQFAKKCGFSVEGFNQRSYIKHGQIYDQVYLGLTK